MTNNNNHNDNNNINNNNNNNNNILPLLWTKETILPIMLTPNCCNFWTFWQSNAGWNVIINYTRTVPLHVTVLLCFRAKFWDYIL